MIDPDKARKQREALRRRLERCRIALRNGGRSAGKVKVQPSPFEPISIEQFAWHSPGGRGSA